MISAVTPSALFVAAFDSQLKWCAQIRDEFAGRGFEWRVVVPATRSALSAQQIADAGFGAVEHLSWDDLLATASNSDVVVSALAGPLTRALLFDLSARTEVASHTPVVISGWVGVIIEKITAGYLDRCGSDLVAVNSRADLVHFRRVAARLGLGTDNLALTGLPLLGAEPAPPRRGPIRRVLFADQPTVPAAADERRYVYRRLADYARRHPDRQVMLKPRHRPNEDTFHRMLHHPESLLPTDEAPANLVVDYTPIAAQLDSTDLLLTMSSTASLEAIDHGCRVALVLDLGVHERLGNHVFLDSGLLRTFDQIMTDDIAEPAAQWRDDFFFPRTRSCSQAIVDRACELMKTGERPSRNVRDTAYFAAAAEYHRHVVAPRMRRSRQTVGAVRGRITRVGHAVLPPVLVRPLRRLGYQAGVLR